MFDELVHEYCVYRGFIEFSVVDSPGKFLINFTFHSYIQFANMYLRTGFRNIFHYQGCNLILEVSTMINQSVNIYQRTVQQKLGMETLNFLAVVPLLLKLSWRDHLKVIPTWLEFKVLILKSVILARQAMGIAVPVGILSSKKFCRKINVLELARQTNGKDGGGDMKKKNFCLDLPMKGAEKNLTPAAQLPARLC